MSTMQVAVGVSRPSTSFDRGSTATTPDSSSGFRSVNMLDPVDETAIVCDLRSLRSTQR